MSEAQFFDAVYAQADGAAESVPWQHAISRTLIGEWLDAHQPDGSQRALVVAAGLGDDAAALANKGLQVTAFDFAPTAVAWAAERHAGVDVNWQVVDLFDLPEEWAEAFELVIEVFTIQSIPPTRQPAAADAIRRLVAPTGTLVAVALIHQGDGDPTGPPWAIDPTTLKRLSDGFAETNRRTEEVDGQRSCVLVELQRGQP